MPATCQQALNWFHAAQLVSLTPDELQKQIDEIQAKMAAPTNRQAALPR